MATQTQTTTALEEERNSIKENWNQVLSEGFPFREFSEPALEQALEISTYNYISHSKQRTNLLASFWVEVFLRGVSYETWSALKHKAYPFLMKQEEITKFMSEDSLDLEECFWIETGDDYVWLSYFDDSYEIYEEMQNLLNEDCEPANLAEWFKKSVTVTDDKLLELANSYLEDDDKKSFEIATGIKLPKVGHTPQEQEEQEALEQQQEATLQQNVTNDIAIIDQLRKKLGQFYYETDDNRVVELKLHSKQIKTLPPEICELEKLQKLNLRDNEIKTLPPELGQLESLQWLNLEYNEIEVVPPELGQLENLTLLFVSDNQIKTLPPELGQLKSLIRLDLRDNQIEVVPPELGQLENLQWLDLSHNEIEDLPPELGQLESLKSLDLSYNKIEVVPPELGQLENLKWLNLSYNEIKTLPPELGQMESLTLLFLSNNQIKTLPPELGQLKSLIRLDLRDNQIEDLPPELGQMENLEWLDLRDNEIKTLPPELGQMENLESLDLSYNEIKTLPPELGQMENLEWLDLSDNEIEDLPEDCEPANLAEWFKKSVTEQEALDTFLGNATELEKAVVELLVENADGNEYDNKTPLQGYLEDLVHSGCQSGMVDGMIFYSETTAFFNVYEDEILEIISNLMEETGINDITELLKNWEGHLYNFTEGNKNFAVWFVIESIANKLLAWLVAESDE